MADAQYIVLSYPRNGVAYNVEEFATRNAVAQVKQDGGTRAIWKRVAVVEANPKVTKDE